MRERIWIPLVLLLVACALALGACGDDEEPSGSSATTEQAGTATTETAPADTEATDTTDDGDDTESGGMTAPSKGGGEDRPEGAGDEVPASSQALITGRDGELRPGTVHVPPFIAIRVELVSADGIEYELTGGGKTVEAGGEIRSASTLLPGIRAGERIVLTGPQGKVTIVADAEPGP